MTDKSNISQPSNINQNKTQQRQLSQDNLNNQISLSKFNMLNIHCSLCSQYVLHSTTTICEHIFCEQCLQEYLLLLDECPVCKIKLRNQRLSNNITLDNLILQYIRVHDHDYLPQYTNRLQKYKEYKKRKIVGQLEAGIEVDIRDSDYIWCVGKVIKTHNKTLDKKVKFVIVRYQKNNKKQQLPQYSCRLAPKGLYTSRHDIPYYERRKVYINDPETGQKCLINYLSQQQEPQIQKLQN